MTDAVRPPDQCNHASINEDITSLKIAQAVGNQKLDAVETMLTNFIKKADESLLTKSEFEAKHWPVKVIVFGLAGAIGMAVITAILAKVIQ